MKEPPDPRKLVITRNKLTTIAASVEGYCQGLLAIAQTNLPASSYSFELYEVLRKMVADVSEQSGLEDWPKLPKEAVLGDLIVATMSLRSLFFCFLSPEDLPESRKLAGFDLKGMSDARKTVSQ